MLTIQEIISTLNKTIEISESSTLMMHSSFKSIGPVEQGPEGVLSALKLFSKQNRTLLLPAFNFTSWPKHHYFDMKETASEMGIITQMAGADKEFVRTAHPIYSFYVYGKDTSQYLKKTSISAMGPDSVFEKFLDDDGVILSVGLDDNDSFTLIHHTELLAQITYRRLKNFAGIYVDSDNQTSIRNYQMFVRNDETIITKVNPALEILFQKNVIKKIDFGNCKLKYTKAKIFFQELTKLIHENPLLLHQRKI